MKSTLTGRVSALSASLILTACTVPAGMTAHAAETANTTKKEIPTYIYSMDEQTATECLFLDSLPLVPYMEPDAYFDHIFTIDCTTEKQPDGTYVMKNDNGSMTVDPNADTVLFPNYDTLIKNDTNKTGTEFDVTYAEDLGQTAEGGEKPVTFDLAKYGIDIIEADGKVYLPLSVLNDFSAVTYNAAVYIEDSLYYFHCMDMETEPYYDRQPLYEQTERTPEMADFTYRDLCFLMDHFYGRPLKAPVSKVLEESDFDTALDSISDQSRRAKELLKSTNKKDFFVGMGMLNGIFNDGGHTFLNVDPASQAEFYSGAPLLSEFYNATFDPQNMDEQNAVDNTDAVGADIEDAKNDAKVEKTVAYEKYGAVKAWEDDGAALYVQGDTAVFAFDSFMNPIVDAFKWSLDYAKEHNVKNFVIDLSTNSGGSSDVLEYMFAMMTNAKEQDAASQLDTISIVTGTLWHNNTSMDLDLNGVIDDADKKVSYDFNYCILTTRASFSCGNLLPFLANEAGICVIGNQTGGGACMAMQFSMADGHFGVISGPVKLTSASGRDIDKGAVPNCTFSGGIDQLYDISAIGSLTEQYYQGTLHAAKGESSVIFTLICIGAVVTVAVISLLLVLHKFHTS